MNNAEASATIQEVISAELTLKVDEDCRSFDAEKIEHELEKVRLELDRYTNHADKTDYAIAIASGLCAGLLDSLFVGEFSLQKAHEWGSEKTNQFVEKVAKAQGYTGESKEGAIRYLADRKDHGDETLKGFHLASDSNTSQFGGGKQHHLRDFAHHASLSGLIFSMLTQFTSKCYGTDTSGSFIVIDVGDDTFIGRDIPQKFLFGTIYWFFHLVSDMAGSGNPDSEGTGIPGPILSAAKLLSATPLFKNALNQKGNRELSVFISRLFNGTFYGERDENNKLVSPLRVDFRTELGVYNQLGKMALPVIMNEMMVRSFYSIRRLTTEITNKDVRSIGDLDTIDWNTVKPAQNRTIDRMLTVATVTFTAADTVDAAVRAAFESGGNYVLFAGSFATRFNFIGAGRAAIAVVKEVSNEQRERQLIREKELLSDLKVLKQLQEYKTSLEQVVSEYLAEDISAFLEGFEYMNEGIASGDSGLVIKGNVIIQRVLGREAQFTNQEEFDELMESDVPLQF